MLKHILKQEFTAFNEHLILFELEFVHRNLPVTEEQLTQALECVIRDICLHGVNFFHYMVIDVLQNNIELQSSLNHVHSRTFSSKSSSQGD